MTCFHLITEPNGYLSNWYPSRFELDGMHYCCAEQYIMRMKAVTFGDDGHAAEVMETEDPAVMQDIGWKVTPFHRHVWAGIRQSVAYRGIKAKFAQNSILRERLIATGDDILAECAYKDRSWGIGYHADDPRVQKVEDWRGKNLLGFALMIVRQEMCEQFSGAERKMPLLHAFAERIEREAHWAGWPGVEYAVTLEEMRSLGLTMDCGDSFKRVCGLDLGDLRELELRASEIDDPLVLGSAIFSQWRYFTHWHDAPVSDEDVRWFEVAAKRLGEITEQHPFVP